MGAQPELPTILIEAIAVGTQVLSADCPSGTAEILENGKWGRLVPVGNVEALAKAIIDQINHPIRANLEDVYERFSADKIIDQYVNLIGRY